MPSAAPQLKANDVLRDLLEAPDLHAAATRNLEALTEEFFLISSTFLEMVRAARAALGLQLCASAAEHVAGRPVPTLRASALGWAQSQAFQSARLGAHV